jgi:hypothetical protein
MSTRPDEPVGEPDNTPTGEPMDLNIDPLSPGTEPPAPAAPEPVDH